MISPARRARRTSWLRLGPIPAWVAPIFASVVAGAAPLKVACIGDSITQGVGVANAALESYPARLQRLLGTNDFTVRNYGVSGRTLLKKGDFPYWKEAFYAQSRAWGPDVVLIKLGTNDSKPYNWRYGTNYVAELVEMVESYRTLPSAPRVILCTPAPVFARGAFDISPGVVATNVAPFVRDVAARLGLEVIDYHQRLAGHAEWFPDTVHPNTRGMAVMAAIAAGAIRRVPPSTTGPTVSVSKNASNRAVVAWPAGALTFVVQSATSLNGTSNAWAVADPVPNTDGTFLRLTNTAAAPRYFRLWEP